MREELDVLRVVVVCPRHPDEVLRTWRAFTLNTEAGASIPDNTGRLGHTSAAAAMIYQHSLDGADERIAKRLSDLIAEGWA